MIKPVLCFLALKRVSQDHKDSPYFYWANLELSNTVKYLDLTFDASMDWHEHINNIYNKVTRRLNLLGRIRKYLDRDTSKLLYTSLVQPLMEYCDIVWSNADSTSLQRLLRPIRKGEHGLFSKRRSGKTVPQICIVNWDGSSCLNVGIFTTKMLLA